MSIDTSECGDRPTRMIGVISLKACVSGLPDDLHIICDVVSSYVISQHYFSWPGRLDGGRLRLAGCSHISIDQSNAVIFDANNRRQFIERGSVSVMQSFFFVYTSKVLWSYEYCCSTFCIWSTQLKNKLAKGWTGFLFGLSFSLAQPLLTTAYAFITNANCWVCLNKPN